ncbi:ATP-binding protein [Actinomadura adrarensis]|uniref:ATP-binding protein n=1 Tax=Actinomadura adrarensis TaxID=1819600 RepID=A0ABW3CRM9_9ACTN
MVTTRHHELIFPMLASPASIGVARTLTDARLRNWDNSSILDDALLIVTELVTNAAEITPGKKIVFQLSRDAGGIIIAVWDSSILMPEPKPVVELTLEDLDLSPENFDNNGGWGLPLVEALSASCGVTRDPKGGKWVWAHLTP